MKQREITILARDGTKIPISLIYKKGINLKKCSIIAIWLWILWINYRTLI